MKPHANGQGDEAAALVKALRFNVASLCHYGDIARIPGDKPMHCIPDQNTADTTSLRIRG